MRQVSFLCKVYVRTHGYKSVHHVKILNIVICREVLLWRLVLTQLLSKGLTRYVIQIIVSLLYSAINEIPTLSSLSLALLPPMQKILLGTNKYIVSFSVHTLYVSDLLNNFPSLG